MIFKAPSVMDLHGPLLWNPSLGSPTVGEETFVLSFYCILVTYMCLLLFGRILSYYDETFWTLRMESFPWFPCGE